jgi:hypothetical protein
MTDNNNNNNGASLVQTMTVRLTPTVYQESVEWLAEGGGIEAHADSLENAIFEFEQELVVYQRRMGWLTRHYVLAFVLVSKVDVKLANDDSRAISWSDSQGYGADPAQLIEAVK